jgi:hypothetical protein
MFEERNRQYEEKESPKRIALLLSNNTEIFHNSQKKNKDLYFSKMSIKKNY